VRVVAIIGARLNSSRLPGKHLLPLANKPLIQRLLERLQQCNLLSEIVLATTADAFNQPLLEWAEGNCSCFAYQGDVDDLVGRIDTVVVDYCAEIVVYICGDCPLVDPGFIDHGVRALMDKPQYHTLALQPGMESIHEGIDFYTRRGWDKLVLHSTTPVEREHVGYANKSKHCLTTLMIADSDDHSAVQHRISVDTPADYDFMVQVYDRWYKRRDEAGIVPLKWLQAQLQKSPELTDINIHVMQKRPEKHYQRIALYCHVSASIGMGHVNRCSRIAATLVENFGMTVHVHVSGQKNSIKGLPANSRWYENDESLFQQMEADTSYGWILDFHPEFIDTRRLVEVCAGKKRQSNSNVIVLDRLEELLPVADHWFIPSFYCESRSPKTSVGWDNYILPRPIQAEKINQLLVLTGGSDALSYGCWLPELLQHNVPADWQIQWVRGPYANDPTLPEKKARWLVDHNPDDLQQLIASSKIILSCYGVSLFEAMRSGATTLLLPVKHLCGGDELAALKKYQCCLVADRAADIAGLLALAVSDNDEVGRYRENASKLLSNANGAIAIGNLLQNAGLAGPAVEIGKDSGLSS
jgi:spore coat polysaccharide biosynthesis protein SpsF (cytidylyltransferase family)/spore coat polysaccharide biosynthesis predicted glycosyltransferase SpsG